jgi:hypothetical protein
VSYGIQYEILNLEMLMDEAPKKVSDLTAFF